MGWFYDVPAGGYVGLTDAKLNDAQSGYETGMSGIAGLLGGMDMFNIGGLIDALKTFDFGKAVIDDEIAQMMKRMKRGVSFNDDDLGINLIKEIGPGGSFITAKVSIGQRLLWLNCPTERIAQCAILPKSLTPYFAKPAHWLKFARWRHNRRVVFGHSGKPSVGIHFPCLAHAGVIQQNIDLV